MARKHEAAELLHSGLSPSKIASRMGISTGSVVGYLHNQVGEGAITRSGILFSIGAEVREAVEQILQEPMEPPLEWNRWFVRAKVRGSRPDIDPEEAMLYFDLKQPQVYLLDMYWQIYSLETFLHRYVKSTFVAGLGADWWFRGIPENIRAECAAARERDYEKVRAEEPYSYITFIQLKEIFEKRWAIFSKLLPSAPASDRRRFLSGLTEINHIRNCVMHPAKGLVPTEDVFRFVREFMAFAAIDNWEDADSSSAAVTPTEPYDAH